MRVALRKKLQSIEYADILDLCKKPAMERDEKEEEKIAMYLQKCIQSFKQYPLNQIVQLSKKMKVHELKENEKVK